MEEYTNLFYIFALYKFVCLSLISGGFTGKYNVTLLFVSFRFLEAGSKGGFRGRSPLSVKTFFSNNLFSTENMHS